LQDCDFSTGESLEIIQSLPECTTLRRLGMAKNDVGDKCVLKLAALICAGTCYINAVDLSGNKIGKKAYSTFLSSLAQPSCRITSVFLNEVPFPKAASSQFSELTNSYVKSLSFRNSDMPSQALIELGNLIASNRSLKSVDVSYNSFDSGALKTFGTSVNAALSLEELNISSTSSKPDGLCDFFGELNVNVTIQTLIVNSSKLSIKTLQTLAAVLNNPRSHIHTVQLRGIITPNEALISFFQTLNNKSALRVVDLRFSPKINRLELGEDYYKLSNVRCLFSPDPPSK